MTPVPLFHPMAVVLACTAFGGALCVAQEQQAAPHFAGVGHQRPADHLLSAATARLYDQWNPLADFDNEFYTLFKYSRITGIGKDTLVSRRDPSKVVKLGERYYVWYTRRKTEKPPVGLRNYTDDVPDDVPAWDWDLADIYYATSTNGFDWEEQGVAVARNLDGGYADRSLSTPDVLCVNGKYYLYYQAFTGRFSRERGDRCDVKAMVVQPPVAAGPYCVDAFAGNGDGRGICWGISHIVGSGNGFLLRFDCDLHRDVDRPFLKHGTVQADEVGHFTPRMTLPNNLQRQFAEEAASAEEETANIDLGARGVK